MTPTARWGALALLLAPVGVWALGLGEIELKSALNQPLDAEIQLVSATPEELSNLTVGLASRATFDRYGLDRPAYLDGMTFRVATNDLGRPVILVNSRRPITEPFVTMLVEAIWARGRLLREYTVLLDPPILLNSTVLLPVPEVARSIQPAATGLPDTTRPAGPIIRPAPAPVAPPTAINRPAPAPVAPPTVPTAPPLQTREPIRIGAPSSAGGSYGPIRRAETLWAIAEQYRPDGITMNQMLVAIYSANLHAFGGNMNTLYQDVTLRIPQLAELGGVSSVAATQEALRQTALWEGGAASPGTAQQSAAEQRVADQRAAQPVVEQQARLRLVAPPSEPDTGISAGGNTVAATAEIVALEGELGSTRDELENNRRLLEVRGEQMLELQTRLTEAEEARQRLAEQAAAASSEPQLPTATGADFEPEAVFADVAEPLAEITPVIPEPVGVAPTAAINRVVTTPDQPSLISRILGWFTLPVLLFGLGALVLTGAAVAYLRYRQADVVTDVTGNWDALEPNLEDVDDTSAAATGLLGPESESDEVDFLVAAEPTAEVEALDSLPEPPPVPLPAAEPEPSLIPEAEFDSTSPTIDQAMTGTAAPSAEPAFDDTMSSQTLINLEQADPIAEADFHMAYGLYDQAAELVEKALEVEPGRRDLKLKLLEVFFVWGNQDLFLETAQDLRTEMGSAPDAEWDKVIIMGKQLCPDDALFSAATPSAGVVDVALDSGDSPTLDLPVGADAADDAGADLDLDIGDFGSDDVDVKLEATGTQESFGEQTDLGADTLEGIETALFEQAGEGGAEVAPELELDGLAATQESPTTSMPAEIASALEDAGEPGEQAAEINLDDLGLDIEDLGDLNDEVWALSGADDAEATEPSVAVDDDILTSSGVDEVLGEAAADTLPGTDTGSDFGLDNLLAEDDEPLAQPMAQTVGSDVVAVGSETTDVDFDAGFETSAGDSSESELDQTGLLDPHTMTMTDVATKLDLARAYVDMGDQDGARVILEEVIQEGTPGQQQEAQGIIDGL